MDRRQPGPSKQRWTNQEGRRSYNSRNTQYQDRGQSQGSTRPTSRHETEFYERSDSDRNQRDSRWRPRKQYNYANGPANQQNNDALDSNFPYDNGRSRPGWNNSRSSGRDNHDERYNNNHGHYERNGGQNQRSNQYPNDSQWTNEREEHWRGPHPESTESFNRQSNWVPPQHNWHPQSQVMHKDHWPPPEQQWEPQRPVQYWHGQRVDYTPPAAAAPVSHFNQNYPLPMPMTHMPPQAVDWEPPRPIEDHLHHRLNHPHQPASQRETYHYDQTSGDTQYRQQSQYRTGDKRRYNQNNDRYDDDNPQKRRRRTSPQPHGTANNNRRRQRSVSPEQDSYDRPPERNRKPYHHQHSHKNYHSYPDSTRTTQPSYRQYNNNSNNNRGNRFNNHNKHNNYQGNRDNYRGRQDRRDSSPSRRSESRRSDSRSSQSEASTWSRRSSLSRRSGSRRYHSIEPRDRSQSRSPSPSPERFDGRNKSRSAAKHRLPQKSAPIFPTLKDIPLATSRAVLPNTSATRADDVESPYSEKPPVDQEPPSAESPPSTAEHPSKFKPIVSASLKQFFPDAASQISRTQSSNSMPPPPLPAHTSTLPPPPPSLPPKPTTFGMQGRYPPAHRESHSKTQTPQSVASRSPYENAAHTAQANQDREEPESIHVGEGSPISASQAANPPVLPIDHGKPVIPQAESQADISEGVPSTTLELVAKAPEQPVPVTKSDKSKEQVSIVPKKPTDYYKILNQVGEGTFGKVYKAINQQSRAYVALKRIRMEGEKDGFPVTAMREVKLLQSLRHENIVTLHEMMVAKGLVYMVFEYVHHDLVGILGQTQMMLAPEHLKSLSQQMLDGLAYLHSKSVIHRDLKASNILVNSNGDLKIADFGLARFYHKRRQVDYTNRVITLWYRPPELLLGATVYGPEVDIWSAGCIFLELFVKKPIFQGNDEIHQLEVMFRIMGTPDVAHWPNLPSLPWYELVKPADDMPPQFRAFFKKWLSPSALDLAERMFTYDPRKRLTAEESLQHEYFTTEEPTPLRADLTSLDGEWHELESKRERAKRRKRADPEIIPPQR